MKTLIIIFLGFIALVGLVIRFLKGPGHDEPLNKYRAQPFDELDEHEYKIGE